MRRFHSVAARPERSARRAWAPYSSGRVHLLYSLSKTFTATALALTVKEGHVGLDDPVVRYFPEIDPAKLDDRVRRMRIRHLACMASGHVEDTWHRGPATDPESPVRRFLSMPPEGEPGTLFSYNQSATYTLATIVQRVSGTTVNDYLQERLLRRIGAGPTSWLQHPPGQDLGFSGLHATTEDLARLGQLYLQDGHWGGDLMLPAGWTAEASRVQVVTDPSPATGQTPLPDWAQGYGFQMWRSRHGYRGDGAYGQYCLVLPSYDAVVAMTGQTMDMQAALDVVWTHLLPAFDADTGCSPHADDDLAARLQGLRLPAAPGRLSPGEVARNWLERALVPAAPAHGTVTARWVTAPLHALPLRSTCSPATAAATR